MTPTAKRWVLAAVAALLTAWVVAPAAVPIYDGISAPDEPYRWVDPPPTAKTTKQPTEAKATVSVSGGQSAAQFANSAEQGPQVSLYLPKGALQVPAGVSAISVTATPLAPHAPLPTDGTIVTNVYRLAATASGQPVSVIGTGSHEPTLQMRAPTAQQPGPVFEHHSANGWQQVHTLRVGQDIYQAAVPTLGDWALVRLTRQASSSGFSPGLLFGGIAVLVVAAVILVIRLRRSGSPA